MWISVLKFNLSPKLSFFANNGNEADKVVSRSNDIAGDDSFPTEYRSNGGGSGYHYPDEECNGMLRVWDGPLREVPFCNDLNWYECCPQKL